MQRGARLGAIGCINDAIQRKSKACLFNRFADYRQPRSGFVQIGRDPGVRAHLLLMGRLIHRTVTHGTV